MSTKKARRFSLPEQKLESLKEHAEQKASEATRSADVVTDIPLSKLSPAPWNARRYFDEASLRALGDDLRDNGQIHPLVVRPKDGGFEIVVGERRYRAARLGDLPTLKATVRDLDDASAQRVSLAENLSREDLNTFRGDGGLFAASRFGARVLPRLCRLSGGRRGCRGYGEAAALQPLREAATHR